MNRFTIIQRMSGFSFYSALIKVVWGITFLMPYDTFATSPIGYSGMSAIATENQWGIFLLCAGILHTWSIFTRALYFRIISQIASIGIWIFIATQFWLSNPAGTGKVTYTIAALLDMIAIVYIVYYKGGDYK